MRRMLEHAWCVQQHITYMYMNMHVYLQISPKGVNANNCNEDCAQAFLAIKITNARHKVIYIHLLSNNKGRP